jgi:hypothetical protein
VQACLDAAHACEHPPAIAGIKQSRGQCGRRVSQQKTRGRASRHGLVWRDQWSYVFAIGDCNGNPIMMLVGVLVLAAVMQKTYKGKAVTVTAKERMGVKLAK